MTSRLVRSTLIAAAALALAGASAACGAAKPRWIEGERVEWTLPLVASEGELIVPVTIGGRGPYDFLFLPGVSAIDEGVAEEVGLYTDHRWRDVLAHTDHLVRRRVYEVLDLAAGDLVLKNFKTIGVPRGSLDRGGRRIAGILGGPLGSTVVVDVDRDAKAVHLAVTGFQRIPEDAVAVRGRMDQGQLYLPARLPDGRELELRVDLGRPTSALDPAVFRRLDLPPVALTDTVVDPVGVRSAVHGGGRVARLGLGRVPLDDVAVAPDADVSRRYRDNVDSGVLGRNVLERYRTIIDRDRGVLWLAPRHAGAPSARL